MDNDSLVERYKQGDKEAISAVEREYRSRVQARIKRFFPTEDDNQFVNKLTRQVFKKARRGELKHDNLQLWIYRIQKNLCIDHVRKRIVREKKAKKAEDMEKFNREEAIRLREDDVENELLRKESLVAIRSCLELIDEKRAEVLEARFFEGRKYKQIAKDLQIPIGTVKSRIFRAKEDLEEIMREKYPGIY